MGQKNILLFLFLFVIASGLYGQKSSTNHLLIPADEPNVYLGSITWPDIPASFKGEVAGAYGWKGDTIPSFDSLTMNYELILPMAYQYRIPALTFSTRHPNSKVVVTRAKSLEGTVAERTITFTVMAEDSSTTNVYSVLLKKEQDTLDNQQGLSSNTLLTSAIYTVNVIGSTGTISGFPKYTLLKTVLAGVVIPAGATLTMVDQNDAYKTLIKLNYDTVYIDVMATSAVYFEVIAENGVSKVLYQLIPTSLSSDAYVTSDLYSIDQYSSLLYPVIPGTSVTSLFRNVTPAPGASMTVVDKTGYVRPSGVIAKDDLLVVTSEDGTITKSYYFKIPNYDGSPYLAYILSDDYLIDQVSRMIKDVSPGTGIAVFIAKLKPAWGATIKVIDVNGNESTLATLMPGDKVLVTSADGTQTATYSIAIKTGIDPVDVASTISMVPNPTSGRVVVQGLAKGNRLRVMNPVGIVLLDRIADHSTETISLDAQPAGIYLFVVSAGTQHIKIQKMVKK